MKLEKPIFLNPQLLPIHPDEDDGGISFFSQRFEGPYHPDKDPDGITIIELPDIGLVVRDGWHRVSSAAGTSQLVKVGEIITLAEQL